jgi:hypothetical protein
MTSAGNPLLDLLRDPTAARGFALSDWNLFLRQGRRERTLARLSYLLQDAGAADEAPPRVHENLRAARASVDFHQVQARREIRVILRALEGMAVDLILLKGSAYLLRGLPLSRGRLMADVDILVRRGQLPDVEQRLLDRGWEPQKLDRYDQRYYREWMHEIPPMRNPESGIELDVHHTLLPVTARATPDPEVLWEASEPLGDGGLRTLCPAHMVLHSAAHLFYDGEIQGGLRDLVDLHLMLKYFGGESGFRETLSRQAEALQLSRPLYYALRYGRRLLGTPVEPGLLEYAERTWAPPPPARRLMDVLVERVLTPGLPEAPGAPLSAWLLYVRSHWLRMPPWLLASHLSRKGWRRLSERWRPGQAPHGTAAG